MKTTRFRCICHFFFSVEFIPNSGGSRGFGALRPVIMRGPLQGCDPTFPSWGSRGAASPPAGSGAEPRRQTHFGNCDVLDNNYYNYRYTSCRTYSADARGKSADGSVNWYTAVTREQHFYSQYDSRYVGCHWLRLDPFLCTNLIGQGPELLTTPAARKNCGDC